MRRSFDGLAATVIDVLEDNPLADHLFLFRGRRADRIKALYRDRNGLAIYYSLVESCKVNKVNPLTYLTHVLEHARDRWHTLLTPDEFTGPNLTDIG